AAPTRSRQGSSLVRAVRTHPDPDVGSTPCPRESPAESLRVRRLQCHVPRLAPPTAWVVKEGSPIGRRTQRAAQAGTTSDWAGSRHRNSEGPTTRNSHPTPGRLRLCNTPRAGPPTGGGAVNTIETDYLVVGAGAAGMAFTDALVADSDAEVVMV